MLAAERRPSVCCCRAAPSRQQLTAAGHALLLRRAHAELFVLDKQLGKGAFGVVHLAKAKSTGELAAVKSISKAKLVCKEDVKDVQTEVAIMNMVGGHRNVVTLSVRRPAARPTRSAAAAAAPAAWLAPHITRLRAPEQRGRTPALARSRSHACPHARTCARPKHRAV